jgi:hypothetical protein
MGDAELKVLDEILKRHLTDIRHYQLAIAVSANAMVAGLYGRDLRQAVVKYLTALDEYLLLQEADRLAGGGH